MSGAGCDVASLPATRVQIGLGAVLRHSNTLGWLRFCGQLSGRFVVPERRTGLCPGGTV